MKDGALFKGVLLVALLTCVPSWGSAQSQDDRRGYVIGLGGMTSTDVTSPFFGASAGLNVAPHLQITADIGRMKDVVANFTRQDLALLDQAVNRGTYGPVLTSSVKVPTNYATGGVRVPFYVGKYARPYVSVSAGVAHMSPVPNFTYAYAGMTQDITSGLMSTQRPGCAWSNSSSCVPSAFREETRPMVSGGAGLGLTVAHHVTLDLGYRYSGIFIPTDYLQDLKASPDSHTRIDTHRFFAGLGVVF